MREKLGGHCCYVWVSRRFTWHQSTVDNFHRRPLQSIPIVATTKVTQQLKAYERVYTLIQQYDIIAVYPLSRVVWYPVFFAVSIALTRFMTTAVSLKATRRANILWPMMINRGVPACSVMRCVFYIIEQTAGVSFTYWIQRYAWCFSTVSVVLFLWWQPTFSCSKCFVILVLRYS